MKKNNQIIKDFIKDCKNRILIVSGDLPGVGKSYVIERWKKTLENAGIPVKVCAVTNRASVISGKSAAATFRTYTVVRHLSRKKVRDNESHKLVWESSLKEETYWTRPVLHERKHNVYIVDEAFLWSMEQWKTVVDAYPNSFFILVGDSAQFSPVDNKEPISLPHISLCHAYRQSDKVFISFIKELKQGKVNLGYIKDSFSVKSDKLKYIDTCYRKELDFEVRPEVELFRSNDNFFYYKLDGKWRDFSTGKETSKLFNLRGESMKYMHLHLLQGTTLPPEIGLTYYVDDFFIKNKSSKKVRNVFLKSLYVTFTRIRFPEQLYVPEEERNAIAEILESCDNDSLPVLEDYGKSILDTDSDFLGMLSADEIFSLFNDFGVDFPMDLSEIRFKPMTQSEFDKAFKLRFENKMKMLQSQVEPMYTPLNELNRSQWRKVEGDDKIGCKSHNFLCFEVDYPKGKTELTPEGFFSYFNAKILRNYEDIFYCVVYSGHNSLHCYVYNVHELDKEHYYALWDMINLRIFEGFADKAKRCYGATLCRAPYALRQDTGKIQELVSFKGSALDYTADFIDKNPDFKVPSAINDLYEDDGLADDVRCMYSVKEEYDLILRTYNWILDESKWKITDRDGEGRYRTLCSIVERVSSWEHRRLTNEACKELFYMVGHKMKLTDQRIASAINARMNTKFKKVVTIDSFAKARERQAAFRKANDKAIESEALDIFVRTRNIGRALEGMALLYDNYERFNSFRKVLKEGSIISIRKECKKLLKGKNFIMGRDGLYNVMGWTRQSDDKISGKVYGKLSKGISFFNAIAGLSKTEIRKVLKDSEYLKVTMGKKDVAKVIAASNKETKTEFERNKALMADFRNGMKQTDIAKKYGISKGRVSVLLRPFKKAR